VAAVADSTQSIWIHDIANGIKKRLTSGSAYEYSPKWSPDGKSVAYTEDNHDEYRVLIIEVASGASKVVQPPTKERTILEEWSADGQYIFFTRGSAQSRLAGYYRKRPDGSGYEAVTLLKENARYPRLSPNRRFYLYSSSEYYVNVKPFPEGPESWQVSLDSGVYWPRWSGDGREIFFVWNGALMAVEVSTQGVFSNGRPRMLFRIPGAAGASVSASRFEIMPDGSFAFIEAEPSQSGHPASIRVVENWLPGSVGNIE
jgi:dipeptidyl aminopeptidase/acylaminoacyl peptidase